MELHDIHTLYAQHPETETIARTIDKHLSQHILARGLNGSARAMTLVTLAQRIKRTMLIVLENAEQASYLMHDAEVLLDLKQNSTTIKDTSSPIHAFLFPTTHRLRQKSQDESYTIQRTEVLSALANFSSDRSALIITYPEAIAESVATQQELITNSITLATGQTIQETSIIEHLAELGFERVDFVYEPGQFAVRGGIVDIYSFASDYPYRLDFFGDEIDSIRLFDIETQLSRSRIEKADIVGKCRADNNSDTTIYPICRRILFSQQRT